MEIKHGRMSMAAVTGVLVTYSGMRWPGYLSTSEGIKFSDIPVRHLPPSPPLPSLLAPSGLGSGLGSGLELRLVLGLGLGLG